MSSSLNRILVNFSLAAGEKEKKISKDFNFKHLILYIPLNKTKYFRLQLYDSKCIALRLILNTAA